MKRIAVLLTCALVVSGCAGAGARVRQNPTDEQRAIVGTGATSSTAKPPQLSIFPDAARVTPNSTVSVKQSYPHAYEAETGSLNGAYFELNRSDGSALVSMNSSFYDSWRIETKYDLIEDSLGIHAIRQSLMIFLRPDLIVAVFGETFPGSGVALRINDNPPLRTDSGPLFIGADAEQALDQIRSGATVTTRYTKWPERVSVDDRWEIAESEIQTVLYLADWISQNAITERLKAIDPH